MIDYVSYEENATRQLKRLYQSYGYFPYKLGSFEEYSLYMRNSDFLISSNVATFNADGRLLALRPDVTLSIIKNVTPKRGQTLKLFYDEKVYRAPLGSREFREVSQVGVEVIGEVDAVAEAEAVELALKTLRTVGGNYVLDIAHVGVITAFLSALRLSEEEKRKALGFLRSKNKHGFAAFAAQKNCPNEAAEAYLSLMAADGDVDLVLPALETLCVTDEARGALNELKTLVGLLGDHKEKISVDFSIANNATYYNGIIFTGYVEGVPRSVLSGGRYDKLLHNFSKSSGAIGFALYLGELNGHFERQPYSPDVAVVYRKNGKRAFSAARKIRESGRSAVVCKTPPVGFNGEVLYTEEEE